MRFFNTAGPVRAEDRGWPIHPIGVEFSKERTLARFGAEPAQ